MLFRQADEVVVGVGLGGGDPPVKVLKGKKSAITLAIYIAFET